MLGSSFPILLVSALLIGGMSNPLYSLLIAHTNDFLEHDDMAAAVRRDGVHQRAGSDCGPADHRLDDGAGRGRGDFSCSSRCCLFAMAGYAAYRMTQRAAPTVEETDSYTPIMRVGHRRWL